MAQRKNARSIPRQQVHEAVAHLLALAVCREQGGPNPKLADARAEAVVGRVIGSLLAHKLRVRDANQRSLSVYICGHVAAAYRRHARDPSRTKGDLLSDVEGILLHAGFGATRGQIQIFAIGRDEIRLVGNRQAAATKVGRLMQVSGRQMYNRRNADLPHPFEIVAYGREASEHQILRLVLETFGLNEAQQTRLCGVLADIRLLQGDLAAEGSGHSTSTSTDESEGSQPLGRHGR
jgi:hypothetical protein